MSNSKIVKLKPVEKKPETPVAKPAKWICPKCQTAATEEQVMVVQAFGYSGLHCVRCWTDIVRQAVPQLVPIQQPETKTTPPPSES